jgi:hypothetical protein
MGEEYGYLLASKRVRSCVLCRLGKAYEWYDCMVH